MLNKVNEEQSPILDGFEKEFDAVQKMQVGSEEWSRGTKGLSEKYKLALEEYKLGLEITDREARLYSSEELKKRELEVREQEVAAENRKSWVEIVKTAVVVAGTFFLTLVNFQYDANDSIPNRERTSLTKDLFKNVKLR